MKSIATKKLIATVATAGLLVVGGAGTAFAADTGGSSTPTQPGASSPARVRPAFRQGLRKAVLKVSADTIGIDVKQLRTDLRAGRSIAQVAQSKSVEPKKVVDAIVKAADAKVAALVKSGTITADRQTKLDARIPQFADRVVNHVPKAAAAPNAAGGSGASTPAG